MMSADTLYRAARTRLPLLILAALAACSGDKNRESNSPLSGSDNPSLGVVQTPNKQDWKQCENGRDLKSTCDWITGNLTSTQNIYREGDVVPHILRISTINNTNPIPVVMTYGFKKGGKSTFDYIADWNATMVNANPCNDNNFSAFCTNGVLKPITATSNTISAPSNISSADGLAYTAATGATAPARVIRGIGVSNITVGVPVLDAPNGSDVEATVTVTITPQAGQTEVLLLIGAHVARGKDWPNGGASSVPGSPYHLGLITVDGKSAGSMDLQMASNTIIPDTKLTLVKLINNGDGGTAQLADFPLTATGPVTITGVSGTAAVTGALVTPGDYVLSEQTNPNYTASAWSCTNVDGTAATLAGSTVTLAEGADVTCTITNDDKPGTLQLVKIVKNDNGGTATVANFTIATSAGTPTWTPSGTAPTITYTSQEFTVKAGVSYTFTEADIAGYAEGTWSCTGAAATGTAFNAGSVTVPLNTKVVCTITNDDNQGSLTIIKKVINDNGGTAVIGDFGITTTAGTPQFTSVPNGTTTTYTSIPIAVNAGTYTLVEKDLAAYAEGTWSCTSGTGKTAATDGSVTVAPSTNVVCTIENNDIPGTLQIIKRVVNDNGGTATVSAFGLSTSATPTLTFGAGQVSGNALAYSSQVISVNAGSYTLRENDISGYTEGTWSCTGAVPSNNTITGGLVTVPVATNVVCTITNDDSQGSLTIIKKVINDNGGTAVVGDFGITTTAGTPQFTSVPNGTTTTYTSIPIAVNAGTYTLVEKDLAGYAEGTWSCTSGTAKTAATDGSVNVAPATAVVCTIENNDIPPSLKLVKVVINDDGGTAVPTDFTLSASGATPISGTSPVTSGATFQAGTYSLSETAAAGILAKYEQKGWVCTGGTLSGSNITIGIGQSLTCTVTNDDRKATLQIVKKVVNDNGGTLKVGDFSLATNAGGLTFDAGTTVGSTTTYTAQALSVAAGAYTLTEKDVAGYAEGTWSCTGATPSNTSATAGSVTVPAAGAVVCTIINDDIAPKLTVRKVVQTTWGGTAAPSAFTVTATGPSTITGPGLATSGADFKAGTYALSETTVTGYTLVGWNCSVNGGPATTAASVTLGLGDSGACTVTNRDLPGKLIIEKALKGAGSTFNFGVTASGSASALATPAIAVATNGTASAPAIELRAGSYTVNEALAGDYVLTDVSCSDGTLGSPTNRSVTVTVKIGTTVTCTFVNSGLKTTRTQGFWQTHTGILQVALFGGTAGGITVNTPWANLNVCNVQVTSLELALGGFWSNIAKLTTGTKRSDVGQARMQLAQQLMAAIANSNFFGSAPSGGTSVAQAQAICNDPAATVDQIKGAMSAMAAFNESGDSGLFTPGASADAKNAKTIALLLPWDVNN